jgi:hypothetical protein
MLSACPAGCGSRDLLGFVSAGAGKEDYCRNGHDKQEYHPEEDGNSNRFFLRFAVE